jgi:hypothetical protein
LAKKISHYGKSQSSMTGKLVTFDNYSPQKNENEKIQLDWKDQTY